MERKLPAPDALLDLDCLHCALNQVINTTQLVAVPEEERRRIMQKALRLMGEMEPGTNNCLVIGSVYRLVCHELGDPDPYRATRAFYDREMLRLLPELRRHIAESGEPLRAAVRMSIAGNLIDLAALGNDVTLDKAMAKLQEVDREGLYVDDCDSLADALSHARSVLVLGDNCGEIALDRLLVETIRQLYPSLHVLYGVRGAPIVNDATREDAQLVGMEEVAEVIDNGDNLLTTMLCRCSPAFVEAFYDADVIIAKGMGNFEGLMHCDRGNIWFMLISKCATIARLTSTPRGSIICKRLPPPEER